MKYTDQDLRFQMKRIWNGSNPEKPEDSMKNQVYDVLEECLGITAEKRDYLRERLKTIDRIINENKIPMLQLRHLLGGSLSQELIKYDHVKNEFRDSETVGNLGYIRRVLGQFLSEYLGDTMNSYDGKPGHVEAPVM
ncbi:MAG: hypothetical protein ABH817_02165 [archaeon]